MGILSLCFVTLLVILIPFIGRGYFATANKGPCQPFKAEQTPLCDELEAYVQSKTGGGFCNSTRASCSVNRRGRLTSRKNLFTWGNCYCDALCKEIGDCCVDYDFRTSISTQTLSSKMLTCRRAPSDIPAFPFGYIMVGTCPPSWKDAETAHACDSVEYSADPLTAVPVLDMTTNITYANTYCAICHGRSRNLQPWTIKVFFLWNNRREPSLQDIKSPDAMWDAVPFKGFRGLADRCVVTPSEAFTEPDTKIKQLCRSYANGIEIGRPPRIRAVFKSPHCAIMGGFKVSAKAKIDCSLGEGRRSLLFPSATIFTFSSFANRPPKVKIPTRKLVHVRFNCSSSEVYHPFEDRCLPVHTVSRDLKDNFPNTTDGSLCRGPTFDSDEFQVSSNNSILLLPHQKIYPNGSYILVNQSLVLCSNFSRNETQQTEMPVAEEKTPRGQSSKSLTAVHIITYVGFSLSIIFLLFLLVTYLLFAELRTYPGKRVMHLSCPLIAMQAVYYASDPDLVSSAACAVVGAMLHFFILVSFFWMSAIAHNTQKMVSTLDINPSNPVVIAKRRKAYIRDSVFCWVFPLVVVGICMALQLTSVGNVRYGNEDGCQLSVPARAYAVACPVSLLIVHNIIAVIRSVVAINTQLQDNTEMAANQRSLPLMVAKLTAVMGITWLLGFLLAFYRTPYLEYPFIIVNSCQGVLISISFVFKKNVFALYKQRFMTETHPEGYEKKASTAEGETTSGKETRSSCAWTSGVHD